MLRDASEPVVLAGVDHEATLYRATSRFPRLIEDAIQGAPNGLKGGEMHSRALEALRRSRLRELEKVIAEYSHLAGGRASNRAKDIVTAAHEGRINKLVLSDSLEMNGAMDEATHQVVGNKQPEGEGYDLVNSAAVQTILHAGQVFVAPNKMMPNGAPLVAIFRY
jgi:hypothetical protein